MRRTAIGGLTTYFATLVAEEVLHVSGVMATIAAGLTIGGWGRMKISYAVRDYLEHFWTYLAFLANALIFLMVGLRVDLSALWATLGLTHRRLKNCKKCMALTSPASPYMLSTSDAGAWPTARR
jgi:NhaP-type Na+/H+ or K+/H+ antiporter